MRAAWPGEWCAPVHPGAVCTSGSHDVLLSAVRRTMRGGCGGYHPTGGPPNPERGQPWIVTNGQAWLRRDGTRQVLTLGVPTGVAMRSSPGSGWPLWWVPCRSRPASGIPVELNAVYRIGSTFVGPDGVQSDLPNLSISVGGGEENNCDCPSNGE